ncbi:MAG: transcriptional repressor [Alphaproteobacteria bacterium]|nr:transcriptional repressor [Alphaproteobacteria bacterium]
MAQCLHQAGLRKTMPRLALAHLLFAAKTTPRHVTAESLFEEAKSANICVSQATIYNTLNQFRDAGLLREVVVDHNGGHYFDTNLEAHHHFYIEEEARLIDVPHTQVALGHLPPPPQGYALDSVDITLRIKSKT